MILYVVFLRALLYDLFVCIYCIWALYISFKCKQPLEEISKVKSCLFDIRRWMITNKLEINDSKTEFIVFRSPQLRCDLSGVLVNVGESHIMQYGEIIECHVWPVSQLWWSYYCYMVGDHLSLLSAQYLVHCLDTENVCHHITTLDHPPRKMKETLFTRHNQTVLPLLANMKKASLQSVSTHLICQHSNRQHGG